MKLNPMALTQSFSLKKKGQQGIHEVQFRFVDYYFFYTKDV